MHDTEKKTRIVCVIVQRGGDDQAKTEVPRDVRISKVQKQLSRVKKKKKHVQKNDWNGVNFLVLIICSI